MNQISKSLIALILVAGISDLSTLAQTITNGSFENPVQASPGYGDLPDNFTESAVNGSGSIVTYASQESNGEYFVGGTGNQFLAINSDDTNGDGTIFYQDAGALQANTIYTLTVSEAAPAATGYGTGTNSFTLLLYNGTDDTSTPVNSTQTTITSPSGGTSTFQNESVQFTTGATVSGDLTVGLENTTATGQVAQDEFDNVVLTETSALTPEPSTYALLGLGLAFLAVTMRSRRSFFKV